MKNKKILLFGILCMFVAPFVYAKEVSEFNIESEIKDGEVYYGENYFLSSYTKESDMYDTNVTVCNEDDSICNSEHSNVYTKLEPGIYKVGFQVSGLNDYEITHPVKWVVNGKEYNPSECGSSNQNDLGCMNFFTIEIKEPNYVKSVDIRGVKTDYKVGDIPNYDYTISEDDKKLYGISEIKWVEDFDNSAITKFENKKYYLQISVDTTNEGLWFIDDVPVKFNGEALPKILIKDPSTGEEYETGRGCETGFSVFYYELDLTKEEEKEDKNVVILPSDSDSDEDKGAAVEVSKVVDQAIRDVEDNKTPVGMDKELVVKVKNALAEGKAVTTEVKQEAIKNEEVKEEVKKAVEDTKSDNQVVLGFFDITIAVKSDNKELGNVTELQDKVTLVLDVKELILKLSEVSSGKKRIFKVIRIHEGKTEILDAVLNSNGNIETESNLFSDYIVIYEDVDDKEENPTEVEPTVKEEEKSASPKTGDRIIAYASLFGLSLIGLVVLNKKLFN